MDNITQIQLEKSKINNPNEIVNAFNKYFITIAEKLTKKNYDKNEAIKLLDTFKNDNIPEMNFIPMSLK
jgi:F0F1-type ATP synthase membrane subunit b/b'